NFNSRKDDVLCSETASSRSKNAEGWIVDTGTTYHITGNVDDVFDSRYPAQGMENFTIGDRTRPPVKAVGSLYLRFQMGSLDVSILSTDLPVKLTNVYVVEGVKFNRFSLYHM
ncbi:unnamed protein product, partial [Sphacelaria rigidula]